MTEEQYENLNWKIIYVAFLVTAALILATLDIKDLRERIERIEQRWDAQQERGEDE